MKTGGILVAALLLVLVVVALIVAWASLGDRPGPMGSTVIHPRSAHSAGGFLDVMLKNFRSQ